MEQQEPAGSGREGRGSVARNAAFNLAGFGIPLLLFLVTTPFYIHLIGAERYGVLAIVWLVLTLFGMLDLGLGRATMQRIAGIDSDAIEDRQSIIGTALVCNVVFGTIGAALMGGVAWLVFAEVLSLDDWLRAESMILVPYVALAVPLMTTIGILQGGLQGAERFGAVNTVLIATSSLFQLLPLGVAAFFSRELQFLVLAALAARFLACIWLYRITIGVFGSGLLGQWRRELVRGLVSYGGWVTLGGIAGTILVFSDRILIGAVIGAVAVTVYAVPLDGTRRIAVIADALSTALFPRFTRADQADEERLTRLAVRALYAICTPLVAVFIVVAHPFMRLWLGDDIGGQSAPIAQVLAVAAWINIFAKPFYSRLQAQGRPEVVAKIHLIQLLPFLLALFWALNAFGLVGAAIVYLARNTIDTIMLQAASGERLQHHPELPLTFAALLVLALAGVRLSLSEPIQLLVWTALAGIVSLALSWRTAPPGLKRLAVGTRPLR
ncbi:flippase [Erythrobacter sp. THAF29]|uniref:flippase n=1 Tax=Erythrobacter sp. THAF29 TaxID=2587851 RepID=UPI001268194D|nr:flippase [Erythrobacter sp. THAF29]QFT75975.1 colanic acid exporter [Erythrobacter sp. THAF29]